MKANVAGKKSDDCSEKAFCTAMQGKGTKLSGALKKHLRATLGGEERGLGEVSHRAAGSV